MNKISLILMMVMVMASCKSAKFVYTKDSLSKCINDYDQKLLRKNLKQDKKSKFIVVREIQFDFQNCIGAFSFELSNKISSVGLHKNIALKINENIYLREENEEVNKKTFDDLEYLLDDYFNSEELDYIKNVFISGSHRGKLK